MANINYLRYLLSCFYRDYIYYKKRVITIVIREIQRKEKQVELRIV